jgi:hypothetical protein
MDLIARQWSGSEWERCRKECHGPLPSRGKARILGDQLAQFIRQESTDTASPARSDRARLLQKTGLDRDGDVVFDSHSSPCMWFT